MKLYKSFYNEETKKLDHIEFKGKNMYDFDHEPDSNLADTVNAHNTIESSVIEWENKFNGMLESGTCDIFKCKDCGRYFLFTYDEREFYEKRNLNLPKRCQLCRSKRKNMNKG